MIDYYATLTILDLLIACVEIALALTALVKINNIKLKLSFFTMALFSALWHISFSGNHLSAIATSWQFQWLEILRYMGWLLLLCNLLMYSRSTQLPWRWSITLYLAIATCFTIFIYDLNHPLNPVPQTMLWYYLKILLCLAAIVMAEQLLRNHDACRISKFVGLVVITQLAYDILVYCNYLLLITENNNLWHARGFVSTATSLLLALCIIIYPFENRQESKLKLSNSVILFNTSFILAGVFLMVMSFVGFMIKWLNIQGAGVFSILFNVMAIFAIATLACTQKFRRHLTVWISKHFFAHKYDYHKEWLKLNQLLSQNNPKDNPYQTALLAMSCLFDCSGGAIWKKGAQFFSLAAVQGSELQATLPIEPNNSEFIQLMSKEQWIFQNSEHITGDKKIYTQYLPAWFTQAKNAWLIVPLNTHNELLGFIFLCKKNVVSSLTWEDLDILKLTGRQIASYIDHQLSSEKLIQNKKFDLFNKLNAFAIHDIKNLVAQQRLMIKNADKFKSNPEFISDIILTITNSVEKMDQLLVKLQGNPLGKVEQINFNKILLSAIDLNAQALPVPTLSVHGPSPYIMADKEKLLMVINHLIKNAQDATDDTGSISIKLSTENDGLWLEIKDSGCGMEQSFINELLFKPFSSTKKNQGMGIGAYQIRAFIHSLQGELFVESIKNQGSKFTIYLPLNNAEQTQAVSY